MEKQLIQELVEKDKDEQEESVRVGLLLSLGIGILNACTYVARGHVFASSQSGNLLYLGLDLSNGEFSNVIKYLFPPLMYAIGIVLAEHYHDKPGYHQWRRIPMFVEIALITGATFLPLTWNNLANPIFGLCCGLQTITFHHIRKTPVSTVFINGSYQNSIVHLTKYLHLHHREDAFRTVLYLLIVIAYLLGIIAGGIMVHAWGKYTSLVTALLLLASCFIVLHPEDQKEDAAAEKA